jgi:hypothetical protein
MLDHDDLFGSKDNNEKFDQAFMKELRKRVDSFIQQGNNN